MTVYWRWSTVFRRKLLGDFHNHNDTHMSPRRDVYIWNKYPEALLVGSTLFLVSRWICFRKHNYAPLLSVLFEEYPDWDANSGFKGGEMRRRECTWSTSVGGVQIPVGNSPAAICDLFAADRGSHLRRLLHEHTVCTVCMFMHRRLRTTLHRYSRIHTQLLG